MNDSFSVLFYIRNSRLDKNRKCLIFLRITVDRPRAEISLKRKVLPNEWNSASGRVKGSKPQVKELNRFLDEVQSRLLKIQGE